jgi:hypothetical protein
MNDEDEPDPFLERLIDETIGPLARLLDAEDLAILRSLLRDDVKDDPELSKLYRAARPRTPELHSHEERTDPSAADPPEGAEVLPFRRRGGAA